MSNPTITPVLNSEWTRSYASIPVAIQPHPELQAGPGRIPVNQPRPKSAGVAFVLSMLLGPVGLCYLSARAGLIATVLSAVVLLVAGAGFVPLLVIWPLAVLGSVWGAGHVHVSG
ncbi:MAG TPA: hypothetical protein VH969_04590 [Actinophytocola sp.]|jgi:hypothetical protein|uniref:hypothetical protein n=1 Tax=Actinophytocola sp. TaxID=1872138 RepID=UPI002F9318FE